MSLFFSIFENHMKCNANIFRWNVAIHYWFDGHRMYRIFTDVSISLPNQISLILFANVANFSLSLSRIRYILNPLFKSVWIYKPHFMLHELHENEKKTAQQQQQQQHRWRLRLHRIITKHTHRYCFLYSIWIFNQEKHTQNVLQCFISGGWSLLYKFFFS